MSDGMQIQSIGIAAAAKAAMSAPASAAAGTTSFKDVLFARIEQVNTLQREAEAAVAELSSGRTRNVDEVLSAVRKADLAFKTLAEIRNKLMEAYQEIQQLRI